MKYRLLVLAIFLVPSFVFAQKKRRPVPALPPKPVIDAPYSEKTLTRVDPHGAKQIKPSLEQAKQIEECSVCHFFQGIDLKTKPNALDSCFNCHNKSPHSGVDEHLKHKTTCTDCHTFHRGDAIEYKPASGRFSQLKEKPLEAGLLEKSSHSAMLKKACSDCHK